MFQPKLPRRSLLKGAAFSGLALVLPFVMLDAEAKQISKLLGSSPVLVPNAFLVLSADNKIIVYAKHLEMGQGVYTGLATILADELDADWANIEVKAAPADARLYNNLFWGASQGTGGSSSIANSWQQLRQAGAQARALMLLAAAKYWQVSQLELKTEQSHVLHPSSGRKVAYGDLIGLARGLPLPKQLKLKNPEQFTKIGQLQSPRVDNIAKTTGRAQFASDIRLPKQLVALVVRPPLFGAKLKQLKDKYCLAEKGVREVLQIPQGVAVLADSFWAAKKGRDALELSWDESGAYRGSTESIRADYTNLLDKSGAVAVQIGDWQQQAGKSAKSLEAVFEFPFLAHAPMEPLSCVIQRNAKGCEIWAGSQSQTGDQARAAKILGLKPEQVTIHTLLAGGSFGRRATPDSDYISEAAEIAKISRFKRQPIQLLWTREDDIRGGYYRPFTMHKVRAGVDSKGQALYWHQRIVTQSIMKSNFKAELKDGLDNTSLEGSSNLAYKIPHRQCELHSPDLPIPILWWRSVGHTHTAFVSESVIDELAVLAGEDPVAYRLALLESRPRMQAVLKKAAEMAGWGRRLSSGTGFGVAVHESFGSSVAEVAQVIMDKGSYRVEKVWCAVDCGRAVNPDIIKAQMEGGIGYALSALQREAIQVRDGRILESNFHDYAPLRMREMPEIEVAIIPSDADPSGVGEPGVPPLAPAVANAIAAVTGQRLRRLPLKL